jgi:glutamyl-tRNA reductase
LRKKGHREIDAPFFCLKIDFPTQIEKNSVYPSLMQFAVIGISHKTASLTIRETLAQVCGELFDPKTALIPDGSFVLLSTCNRTEIYFSSKNLAVSHTWILNRLRSHISQEFEPYLYAYFGRDTFKHLIQVTSGLDSACIGESEIQGQVKRAYIEAHQFSFLSSDLHYLFQKGLHIGKEFRNRFDCQKQTIPIAKVVKRHIEDVFQYSSLRVLFVGYSRMNLSLYSALKLSDGVFCNRSQSKLVGKGLKILPWENLREWTHYDLVFFGTHAGSYLAKAKELVNSSQKKRLIFDLSVPRNVDPKVGYFQGTYLYNLEQLQAEAQVGFIKEKEQWRSLADSFLETQANRYENLLIAKKQRCQGNVGKESHPEYSPFLS